MSDLNPSKSGDENLTQSRKAAKSARCELCDFEHEEVKSYFLVKANLCEACADLPLNKVRLELIEKRKFPCPPPKK